LRELWRRADKALISLLVSFVVLASLYNLLVPLGEGPDESGHMAYVLFLLDGGRLPLQTAEHQDVPGEGHQPPLAYLLASWLLLWLPAEARQLNLTPNPQFMWSGGQEIAAFMRSSQELWPWPAQTWAWHIARALSTVWGLLSLLTCWAIARELKLARWIALLALGLLAFNPQFVFGSALVSNDGLLATLSAAALWLTIRRERALPPQQVEPDGAWYRAWAAAQGQPLALGAVIGLALITKQSAIMLLALLPLAAWWRFQWQWRAWLRYLAGQGIVILLLAGWWYWRNQQLYGDLFGLEAFRSEFITQAWDWRDPRAWRGAFIQLHESFWGRFGWMNIQTPTWWSYTSALLGLLAGAGIVRLLWIGWQRRTLAVLLVLPLLSLAWTFSFALTAGLVAWQGRFLFPASAPIVLLLALGLWAWVDYAPLRERVAKLSEALQSGSLALLAVGMALLCASFAFTQIVPSYRWYVISEREASAEQGQALRLRFAEEWKAGVELRAWRSEQPWKAGQTAEVSLIWFANEPSSRNWTVFLHLIDAQGEIVAEDNTQPLNGLAPMTLWTKGDWYRDLHQIELPADLPVGEYRLEMGLYDEQSRKGRRQGIWDVSGEFIGDHIGLGMILVE
jgi:4-amino-4-deoxy-L-arabinose transferase and related glycosyltransferases of PMT family